MLGNFLQDNVVRHLVKIGLLNVGGGVKREVSHHTADYTVDAATDGSGKAFTNRGATGTVIFTLPAATAALAGVHYRFVGVADFTVTVKPSAVDTLLVKNDLTADSLSLSTGGELIGGEIEAFCDGTVWHAKGLAVGHTYTVAT